MIKRGDDGQMKYTGKRSYAWYAYLRYLVVYSIIVIAATGLAVAIDIINGASAVIAIAVAVVALGAALAIATTSNRIFASRTTTRSSESTSRRVVLGLEAAVLVVIAVGAALMDLGSRTFIPILIAALVVFLVHDIYTFRRDARG